MPVSNLDIRYDIIMYFFSFKGDFKTGAPSGAGSHFAIYPGTKWCGYENVAENMQDLGII